MKKSRSTAPKVDKRYFTEIHEAAIVAYNESMDSDERELLFRNIISAALDKLAENIINRFKFPYINQSFDDLKRQVVSYLIINLHKYTKDKGAAFSYFSVVAKNYLILQNNNGYKQEKRSVSLSDNGETHIPIEEMLMIEAKNDREHDDMKEFVRLLIVYWDDNLTSIFKKKRDIEIASAVIQLFRDVEGIENFNKKALYLLIREMVDCETNYITKVVNKMRIHIALQLQEFNSHGTVHTYDRSKL